MPQLLTFPGPPTDIVHVTKRVPDNGTNTEVSDSSWVVDQVIEARLTLR